MSNDLDRLRCASGIISESGIAGDHAQIRGIIVRALEQAGYRLNAIPSIQDVILVTTPDGAGYTIKLDDR